MIVKTLKEVDRTKVVHLKQIYADPLIKMKKYASTYTSLGPGLDKNGKPSTGLTEDIIQRNPNGTVGKPILGTRVAMEKELDLAEGTLKSTSPYWTRFAIRLGSDPEKLILSDPHDLLHYLFARGQSIVANGFSEIKENSRVEFVLYSEEDEAKEKVVARRSLKTAYRLSDKLDTETKVNLLAVSGIIVDASNTNTIENKIDEMIERNPTQFLEMANDEFLIYKSLVTKCLDKGILIMKDGSIIHGEVNVGYSKDNAAQVISKDVTLQTVLKAKLSGDMDLIQEALKNNK